MGTKESLRVTDYKEKKDYVFISYCSKNEDEVFSNYVIPLQEQFGMRLYFDKNFKDHAAENWSDQMDDNVRRAKLCIAFVSKEYVCSYACLLEILTALVNNVPVLKIQLNEPVISDDIEERSISQSTMNQFKYIVESMDTNKEKFSVYKGYYTRSRIDRGYIRVDDLSEFSIECLAQIANTRINADDGLEHIVESIKNAVKRGNPFEENVPVPVAAVAAEATVVNDKVSKKESKPKEKTVTPISADFEIKKTDITIGQVREYFADTTNAANFRDVRESMPHGGKAAMDYAMASVLGGCNNVVNDSPEYQKNYYLYDIADPTKQKADGKLGATWTWSSNCRKMLFMDGSGQIDAEVEAKLKGLDVSTNLEELQKCFVEQSEKSFVTKKNDLVLLAIQKIIDTLEK